MGRKKKKKTGKEEKSSLLAASDASSASTPASASDDDDQLHRSMSSSSGVGKSSTTRASRQKTRSRTRGTDAGPSSYYDDDADAADERAAGAQKPKKSNELKRREREEARALLAQAAEERVRRAQVPDSVTDPRERCGLLYGCVAHQGVILAQYQHNPGENIPLAARQIVERVKDKRSLKQTFQVEEEYASYNFHVRVRHKLTFLVLATTFYPTDEAFDLLSDLEASWNETFPKLKERQEELAYNSAFVGVLRDQMYAHFLDDGDTIRGAGSQRMAELHQKVEETQDVAIDIIDDLVKRQPRLDELVKKTETTRESAEELYDTSKKLKCSLWWSNLRCRIMCIVVTIVAILIILYVIVSLFCGFDLSCGDGHSIIVIGGNRTASVNLMATVFVQDEDFFEARFGWSPFHLASPDVILSSISDDGDEP